MKKRKKSIGKKDYKKGNQETDGLNMPQGEMRRVTNYPREVRRGRRSSVGLELGRPGCLVSGLIVLLLIFAGIILVGLFPRGAVVLGWGLLGVVFLLAIIAIEADLTPHPWLNFYPLSLIYMTWITLGSMILHFLDGYFGPETGEIRLADGILLSLGIGWMPLFFLILFISMAVHFRKFRDNGLDEL